MQVPRHHVDERRLLLAPAHRRRRVAGDAGVGRIWLQPRTTRLSSGDRRPRRRHRPACARSARTVLPRRRTSAAAPRPPGPRSARWSPRPAGRSSGPARKASATASATAAMAGAALRTAARVTCSSSSMSPTTASAFIAPRPDPRCWRRSVSGSSVTPRAPGASATAPSTGGFSPVAVDAPGASLARACVKASRHALLRHTPPASDTRPASPSRWLAAVAARRAISASTRCRACSCPAAAAALRTGAARASSAAGAGAAPRPRASAWTSTVPYTPASASTADAGNGLG